jgi:hypothetical protein
MHLLTREAFELYVQHLKPGGLLMFHISNRYLRLGDVLARLVMDRGLTALEQLQHLDTMAIAAGQRDSDWVVASADGPGLAALVADGRWTVLASSKNTPLWTDDFSNILAAFRFRQP